MKSVIIPLFAFTFGLHLFAAPTANEDYVDRQDAQTYTNAVTDANAYTDSKLDEAKTYTDNSIAGVWNVSPSMVTNISGKVTSNIVDKAYVESLGIEAGIGKGVATNISASVVTNHVESGYLCTVEAAERMIEQSEEDADRKYIQAVYDENYGIWNVSQNVSFLGGLCVGNNFQRFGCNITFMNGFLMFRDIRSSLPESVETTLKIDGTPILTQGSEDYLEVKATAESAVQPADLEPYCTIEAARQMTNGITAVTKATVTGWGFLESFTESDPNVPDWAKSPTPPTVSDEYITGISEQNRTNHPYLSVSNGGIYIIIPE